VGRPDGRIGGGKVHIWRKIRAASSIRANAAVGIAPGDGYPFRTPASWPDGAATKEDTVLSATQTATSQVAHPDQRTSAPLSETPLQPDALLAEILKSLDDDQAQEVVQIDLRGKSEMADFMVICSGRSSRQVASISDKLVDRLKHDFGRLCKVEGKDGGDWVLIDTGDVIVHVFRPEVREFYQLEKMWLGPTDAPGRA